MWVCLEPKLWAKPCRPVLLCSSSGCGRTKSLPTMPAGSGWSTEGWTSHRLNIILACCIIYHIRHFVYGNALIWFELEWQWPSGKGPQSRHMHRLCEKRHLEQKKKKMNRNNRNANQFTLETPERNSWICLHWYVWATWKNIWSLGVAKFQFVIFLSFVDFTFLMY